MSPSSQAEGRSRLATPRTSDTPGIIRECSKTHRGRRIAVNKELSSETRTLHVAEVENTFAEIDPCRRHRWAWARKLHALLVYQQQCFGEDDGYKHTNVDSDNNTIAPLVIHTKHNSAQRNQASPGHPHPLTPIPGPGRRTNHSLRLFQISPGRRWLAPNRRQAP